ncbi:hypothetical protein B0T19DRAFT_81332 [Cercophora scortea]|uniref:Uncharacterized protein n=1 Tax=Cercophora scortea TaxID=314031 RepID=A0AAE0J721_9PEZI|nr:hypothetical protein B0T19DRAFT_81332 [Cercophora scortea]
MGIPCAQRSRLVKVLAKPLSDVLGGVASGAFMRIRGYINPGTGELTLDAVGSGGMFSSGNGAYLSSGNALSVSLTVCRQTGSSRWIYAE